MDRFKWSELTKPQVGRYAEYFVKMRFTLHGFDVYTAEVDDKGIDFVIRKERDATFTCYFDIQVKSVRDYGLICLPFRVFKPKENLLAAIANSLTASHPNLISSGPLIGNHEQARCSFTTSGPTKTKRRTLMNTNCG